MSIYSDLRDLARKTPDSQFIKVPIVPSLGMLMAAAKATDVFKPGDTLTDYIAPFEIDYGSSGDNIYVHSEMVARFGMQQAYCLAVIADTWSNCLSGVETWFRSRARHNRGLKTTEDLIYFTPDRCPSFGYPATKSDCTDEHRAYSRCTTEPFKGHGVDWYSLDHDTMTVAPRKLPYYAANCAARDDLSVASFLEFSDVMDFSTVPYVPNFSYDGAFTDEERYELLISAIWRECVVWLISEDQADAVPFPVHPAAQAVIISNAIFRHGELYRRIENFFDGHPYDRITIEGEGTLLTITTLDGKSSYWYQETNTDRIIRSEGLVLQNGYDKSGLREILLKMASKPIKRAEAIPISEPWP
jgi:hypothetical protein